MASRDEIRRIVAGCTDCGSIHAAKRWPDGTLRIMGRDGCQCGSSDLRVVDHANDGRPVDDPGAD